MGSKCFAYCVLLEDQVLTSHWGQQGVEGGCPYCAMQSISRLCLPVRLSLPALLARLWKTTWFLGILLAQVTNDKTSVQDKFSLIQRWIYLALGTAGADSWGKDERVQKGDGTELITKWPKRVFCKSCRKWEFSDSPAMLSDVLFWEHEGCMCPLSPWQGSSC